MATKAERTALVFVSAVVLTGGVVRLVRSARSGLRPAPAATEALARQRRAADSVAGLASGRNQPAAGRPTNRATGRNPARGSRATAGARPSTEGAPAKIIDIDQATADELQTLPRIGPAIAARILEERAAHGPFGSLEALDKRVRGIGPAMVARLRPLVTFSGR